MLTGTGFLDQIRLDSLLCTHLSNDGTQKGICTDTTPLNKQGLMATSTNADAKSAELQSQSFSTQKIEKSCLARVSGSSKARAPKNPLKKLVLAAMSKMEDSNGTSSTPAFSNSVSVRLVTPCTCRSSKLETAAKEGPKAPMMADSSSAPVSHLFRQAWKLPAKCRGQSKADTRQIKVPVNINGARDWLFQQAIRIRGKVGQPDNAV